jgi:methyl-accepting chemotaxis protein
VTNIIAEISSASQEQTMGIDQINQAVAQMDQVTQQNAALVEEAAAASEAMQEQAAHLADVVSVFKLDGMRRASNDLVARSTVRTESSTAPVKLEQKAVKPASASRITANRSVATANAGDWEEF